MHFVSFHKKHSHDNTGTVDPHVFILLGLLSTRNVALLQESYYQGLTFKQHFQNDPYKF